MDSLEQFFKEKIRFIHEEMDKREENFEKQQQEKRDMVMQSNANSSNAEENRRRYHFRNCRTLDCDAEPCFILIRTYTE